MSATVAVVGSGFAGTLAARVLHRLEYRVLLLERGQHPRFALGESSTPLAAIALEALAARYDLPDLRALAAYGRWLAAYPALRRGLKRGFSFYGHQPGRKFADAPLARLLVAASPSDAVADSHWLREDVDAFFVARAAEEGVEVHERVEVTAVCRRPQGVQIQGRQDGRDFAASADFVLDASGGRGLYASVVPGIVAPEPSAVRSALVYGHFTGVHPFAEVATAEGAPLPAPPYPEHWAANHHLTDLGWMYVLPFDDGVTSAGFLLDLDEPAAAGLLAEGGAAAELWARLLARYPSLAAQFEAAEAVRPLGFVPRVQHRLCRAVGEHWLLLPSTYAFSDPLFSTGIAWSLAGVERIGRLFERGLPSAAALARYQQQLACEADHLDRLIAGAYRARRSFRAFAAYAQLYFAAASFGEALRRLHPEADDWAWRGFLGATDELVASWPHAAHDRLTVLGAAPLPAALAAFEEWVAAAIAPRNVAGLADPARGNLYPVDFAPLLAHADLLGLSRAEVEARLPALLR